MKKYSIQTYVFGFLFLFMVLGSLLAVVYAYDVTQERNELRDTVNQQDSELTEKEQELDKLENELEELERLHNIMVDEIWMLNQELESRGAEE